MTRPLADDWVIANPVQRLATEVIKSAIADATRGDADAQVFLDDSDALLWWATVAGVDAGVIVSRFWATQVRSVRAIA